MQQHQPVQFESQSTDRLSCPYCNTICKTTEDWFQHLDLGACSKAAVREVKQCPGCLTTNFYTGFIASAHRRWMTKNCTNDPSKFLREWECRECARVYPAANGGKDTARWCYKSHFPCIHCDKKHGTFEAAKLCSQHHYCQHCYQKYEDPEMKQWCELSHFPCRHCHKQHETADAARHCDWSHRCVLCNREFASREEALNCMKTC